MNSLARRALVVAAVIATIATNALANILPLNGQNTGEISDRFPVYITPPGYVFSIWSLIYAGLIAYAVYQALPAQRHNARLRAIAAPFLLSCAANIAWLFLWHYNYTALTIVAMLALLGSLLAIYARLRRGPAPDVAERWLVHVPFSIYMGWITVATIVNATVVLYDAGWSGFGLDAQGWTSVLLAVGALIASTIAVRLRDAAYAAVIVWAFVGIAVKHAGTSLVAPAAWAMAAAVALSILVGLWRGGSATSRPLARGA